MVHSVVFVFNDIESDWLCGFKALVKKPSTGHLLTLWKEATAVIRKETATTPELSRSSTWNFTTLQELAYLLEESPNSCPLAFVYALSTFTQIYKVLEFVQSKNQNVLDQELKALGHGIGVISAATFACADGVSNVIDLVPTTIALSFRLGLLAQRKLESVAGAKSRTQNSSSWVSLKLPLDGIVVENLIKDYLLRTGSPIHRKCFVKSVAPSQTIVCGPSEAIQALQNEAKVSGQTEPCLSLFGAAHLYSEFDVAEFDSLISSFDGLKGKYRPNDFGSVEKGEQVPTRLASDIFRQSITELLTCKSDHIMICSRFSKTLDCDTYQILTHDTNKFSKLLVDQIHKHHPNVSGHIVDLSSAGIDLSKTVQPSTQDIAIVGMSGRFPEAADIEKFWELLQAGKDVHRTIPPDRFNFETHADPTGQRKNTAKTPFGCFINNPGLFDPRFFNMSPKEAAQTDPAQRLMILTAYEALEMSGFVPDRTTSSREDRVATFYGQASDDWREVNSSQDIDTYFIPGGIRAFGPGRINYHLKFSGPSYSIDTACSSSFAAIHMACNSLRAGDCDTALAGGANILTNPDIFSGLSHGHFLSPTGSCKTFDHDADGYCRADGVGSVVLKRLEDAEADNDNILGVISGIGTNHSAHAISITHPHAPTQISLYRSILANSRVEPHDIDYVEMHGTGTQAGDFNEMQSVSEIFASRNQPRRKKALYVGSVKANIGHGEAAAGIMSLIKVLLMLRHSSIPPHVGVKGHVNKTLPQDLERRNVHIPFSGAKWLAKSDGSPRIAFLNNFSAAGGNTGLILREHSSRKAFVQQEDIRSALPIVVSARTIRSMRMNIESLRDFLSRNPNTSLADLSYTLTARRLGHSFRKTFTAADVGEVLDFFDNALEEDFTPISTRHPSAVFMFTGQGSMYAGLAKSLFQTCKRFRRDILEYNSIAQKQGFPPFLELIDGSVNDLLSLSPVVLQVGHVCIQLALARLWIAFGVVPKAVIGHSLGEYAALAIAGVVSASDMIYLVGRRAQLLEQHCIPHTHGMVAVNGNATILSNEIAGTGVEISCINGPTMTVLGGQRNKLETCTELLQSKGYKCVTLHTNYAFHTAQVDPILADFANVARSVAISVPTIPVLSPLLGRTVGSTCDSFNAEYFCRHAREPVDFNAVLSHLQGQDEWTEQSIWLEIGPHPTCIKFAEATIGRSIKTAASLKRDVDSWKTLSDASCTLYGQGVGLDWTEFHKDFEDSHRLIELPSYQFDLKNYWIDYAYDWCLYKGQSLNGRPSTESDEVAKPRLSTTSVQKILEEKIEPGKASLLAESDFSEPLLERIATGHKVNGVALCPSSLYADMAFTVGKYLYRAMFPSHSLPVFDVSSMSVNKPFIVDNHHGVVFRIAATANENGIKCRFYTVRREDESNVTEHATCDVRYGEKSKILAKWNRNSYLIKQRMSALASSAVTGTAERIQRNLVYRLFSNFVDYDKEYQGIEEVIIESDLLEAKAKVSLKPPESGSSYEIAPTWIDSLCHLTGVVLNATNTTMNGDFVYISHGWKSLRIITEPKPDATYYTYTRMQETEENYMEGDVWIFDKDEVVGLAKGVKFQRIPRKVINILLPRPGAEPASGNLKPAVSAPANKPSPPVEIARTGSENLLKVVLKNDTTQARSSSVPPTSSRQTAHIVDDVLGVISAECGVDPSELVDGCTFTSLGIDSLLSLEILAKLRESLELDLRPHIFLENETIGNLKQQLARMTLGLEPGIPETPEWEKDSVGLPAISDDSSSSSSATSEIMSRDDCFSDDGQLPKRDSMSSLESEAVEITANSKQPAPKAVSYLLSGNPKTAAKFLFLFPDGSGSATSYATIPSLGPDVCVYGLNCPYMTTPTAWRDGITGVTSLYLSEILRRQPTGPYNLGGWSAGGILAYAAAAALLRSGAAVTRLLLIDSPCPVRLPPMPVKMFKYLDGLGLLGSGNAGGSPEWLIPHFAATVANLDGYVPVPLSEAGQGEVPRTTVVWARRGVTSATGGRRPQREEGDPEVMEWLLEDRVEFGCCGWEKLIPAKAVTCEVVEGHHFSMVNEHVGELGAAMARAMV